MSRRRAERAVDGADRDGGDRCREERQRTRDVERRLVGESLDPLVAHLEATRQPRRRDLSRSTRGAGRPAREADDAAVPKRRRS